MNISRICFDHSLRAEEIHWLACQPDQYTEELTEFFEDHDAKELRSIFGRKIPKNVISGGIDGIMAFLYDAKLMGFLVKVGTPVPTGFTPSGHSSSGFGYITTKWFYAEVLNEAFIEKLVAWQTAYIDKKRADHAKATTP